MASTDPQGAGISEEIVGEEEALGQLDPLEIAKQNARESGRIAGGKDLERVATTIVNLNKQRENRSEGEIYLRDETRERLSRLAYLMSCSYSEVIRKLAGLEYARREKLLLGLLPGEIIPARGIRVRASMTDETKAALEKIAADCQIGRARSIAAKALDAILGGEVVPTKHETLEEAAEALRSNPIANMNAQAEAEDVVDGQILLRISTGAARGVVVIMNYFDQRKNWRKTRLRRVVEALADLPVSYQLVGDILPLRRSQRPFVLPMHTISRLGQVGLDNMLISRPANRRPSALVSETLEYIGQGAIQLIHQRRGLDSLDALKADRKQKR